MTQAVLQNQAAISGRRTREDAEQIIQAWHNSLPEKQVYTYDKYITDSTELTERIADICAYNKTGVRFLFQAMPGGGKTHFVCKDLPRLVNAKTNNEKTIVIACPNNIQCHQNRRQYGTFAVAGDSSDKIKFTRIANKRPYTAVYECVTVLLSRPVSDLKNTVLFVDEAHQLLTENDYRSFTGVMAAIDAVYSAGGVVCMMTATPRPIMYLMPYNAFVVAERKDAKKTNVGSIEYVSVDTRKQIKVYDVMLDEVRAAKNAGHMAVVRYQSKEDIKKARKLLEAEGLTVEILTADCKEKTQDEDGRYVYKSAVYAGLIERGTLPDDIDVLLCTSILEVGTSIVGTNKGGEIVQDADLTPIFVCNRADTDIDKMLQFFARFRFPINQAKVICSKCQNPMQDHVDLTEGADAIAVKNAVNLYMRRDSLATAFSKDRFRRILKSWHGHIDGQGITADGKIDMPLIWADAVQRYFGLVYRQEGAAQVILSTEFGVPVTVTEKDTARKSKTSKSIKIPAEAKDAFRVLVDSDSVFKVLASDDRDIQNDASITRFRESYPDCAKAMIDAIRPYARCEATMPLAIRRDLAIDAAIFNAQHPRTKFPDADTKAIITPATNLNAFYYDLTQYPARIAEKILDAASGIAADPNLSDTDKMMYAADDWHIVWTNRAFVRDVGGQKYDDFLTMWRIFRTLDSKARYEKFRKIAEIFAYCDTETARRARYAYTCVHLNRTEKRGLYADVACPDASYVAAEHKILTHPERHLFRAMRDEKGKIDRRYASKALWYEDNNADGKPCADRFRKGAFIGKELSAQDLQTIADGFGASITKMVGGKAGIIGDKYSADDIFWMIQSCYTVAFLKIKSSEVVPVPENVKNMNEQDIKLKVRGLRLNMPAAWMTVLAPDTTDAELEREKWVNLYTATKAEIEVVEVKKKETPKQIPFTPISYADGLPTKIEKYEKLLTMIDHDDDVESQIHVIEKAYRLGLSILEDCRIFKSDVQGKVADFAYQGGYSHKKFIDILKTHGKNVTL